MTPKAWINTTTGDLIGNHPISWGYDPSEWEPLYSLDQMRECVPARADPGWHGFLYAEGWNDCSDMSLNALDALMKGAE